jgi:hypothetical protein
VFPHPLVAKEYTCSRKFRTILKLWYALYLHLRDFAVRKLKILQINRLVTLPRNFLQSFNFKPIFLETKYKSLVPLCNWCTPSQFLKQFDIHRYSTCYIAANSLMVRIWIKGHQRLFECNLNKRTGVLKRKSSHTRLLFDLLFCPVNPGNLFE